MDTDWQFKLILLFVLLIVSALFSGSEVSLFSIDKKKLKEQTKSKSIIYAYIENLLEFPRRLLVTILLGNTIVNVAASILAVTIALDISAVYNISTELALIVQIILLTILILLFGEITPKVWASKHPYTFAKIVSIPLYWISVLFYPISKTLTDIIKSFASKIKYDKSSTAIRTSELTELADLGVEKGTIEENEHGLIYGLVSFKNITVREVMTPRVDITAVSVDSSFEELMEIITESGHSRIPLYENSLDNIVGIIYAKDLLPFLRSEAKKENFLVRKIARKAIFIPESKLIRDLLEEFQATNTHMGIVVDEYGGTAGLISMEDILEEIVGEIRDEYDKEENEINQISENSYLVLGKVSIDEINELLQTDLSSENDDYDTIGGFILNLAGSIPDEGYILQKDRFKFTVKEVENKRINKILLEIMPEVEEDD
ncbi:MAG: metal transporter [Ignavibacteriae bacterium]|nr:metal transporter [Ignavibacteriota bacterium]